MATLVLTTVGSMVAGPVGGALGALAGQAIDARLFAPKGRRGPRLDDLRVQTSSYGSPIAKIWGRMRIAGTVVWADEIRERRRRQGGGKGQPSTTTYSYSASFAVALSGRPVRSVHRIWADGKLLKGGAGDLKTRVEVRLHAGGEDQAVDPLIGSREGRAPAHRGTALLVFEDLELADFGNRIPSITVEVEADGPVDPHAVAAELGELQAVPSGLAVAGYAVSGGRLADALDEVRALTGAPLNEKGTQLVLGIAGATLALPARAERCSGDGEAIERLAASLLPDAVELGYFDPEREFQAGLQRAGTGIRSETLEVPIAMSAGQAAALAGARLERLRSARERRSVLLPHRWMHISPGRIVTLPESGGRWLVRAARLERMAVHLELEAAPVLADLASPGDGGRALLAPDVQEGATALHLHDLPALPTERLSQPRLLVATAGDEEGWRGASLEVSTDGGSSWRHAGAAAAPAIMGRVIATPARQPLGVWDEDGVLDIELLHEGMWLESRDEAGVLAGDNLAAIGGELIGFAHAEPVGEKRWRLSGLLRGRFGTEDQAGRAGDPFTLLEREALASIDVPTSGLGGQAIVSAASRTGEEVEARAPITARSVRPLAPCHLHAERLADGAVALWWTRRSREGWAWLDGVDAPLGEERELYRVQVGARTIDVAEPRWTYGAAEQQADGLTGTFQFEVVQVGALALSEPAVAQFAGG